MAKQFEGYLSDIYAILCSKTALRRLKTYGFAFGQEFRPMYGKFQKATFCGYNLVEFGRNFVQTVWSHWSGFDLGRGFVLKKGRWTGSYFFRFFEPFWPNSANPIPIDLEAFDT